MLQWFFLWIAIATILLYFLIVRGCRRSLPPGPYPLPIFGNLLALGADPHRSLAGLAKRYGPVIFLSFGTVKTVVVSSPDVAREVLNKRDHEFSHRWVPDALRTHSYHKESLAWQPVSDRWRNLRRICNAHLMNPRVLDGNLSLRRHKARDLVDYIGECCLAGEPVDVGRSVYSTVLNMISNSLFSVDMVDPRSESSHDFRELMRGITEEAGGANLSDFFPWISAIDLQGRRHRMNSHIKRLYAIFDELAEQRRSSASLAATTKDFLGWLIQSRDGFELQPLARNALVMDLFVAGSDTSSTTVEWAMAEIIRNPRAMARARAELIDSFPNADELDEGVVVQLPYLHAVVKETLRLHPPLSLLLPRRAETETELCGYRIPRHARLLFNLWAMGRNDGVWEDPDSFSPERFLGNGIGIDYGGRDFELIPFGAGRRICPGLPLAVRMVHLTLASMLRSFEWKLPEGAEHADMREKFGVTLAKATPLLAIPVVATTASLN